MTTATMPHAFAPSRGEAREATAATEPAPTEIPYFNIYVSSILAVSVFFLVGVGLPLAFALDSMKEGFGLGAFTAVWGGPSFGVMTASARISAWQERLGDH